MKQDVALFHVVALFDHDVGDLADALAQNVGVVLGPDFTRGGDQRDQVLAADAAGLHGDDVLVRLVDADTRRSPRLRGLPAPAIAAFCQIFIDVTLALTAVIDKPARHLIHTLGRGRMFLGSAAVNKISPRTGTGEAGPPPVKFSSSQRALLHAHDHLDDVQLLF